MTQRCKACEHPRRGEIDIEIARGVSGVEIANRYDLPRASVWRHRRNNHVPASVVAAFPQNGSQLSAEALAKLRAEESQGILLNLALQRSRLLACQERAEHRKLYESMVNVSHAIHKNIELTARTLGSFAEHERTIHQVAHLQVMMQPEYIALRSNLIRALRSYPEARRAVGAVLAELEQAPVHFDGVRSGVDGVLEIEGRS